MPGKLRISLSQLGSALPFPRIFRQLEEDIETVVKVLQPGPVGIIEHKFSGDEIRQAKDAVRRAVEVWKMNASIERRNGVLQDYTRT